MATTGTSRIPRIVTATVVALVLGVLVGLFGPFDELFGHPCEGYDGTHVFTIIPSDGPERVKLGSPKADVLARRHCTFALRVDNQTDHDLRVSFEVRRRATSFNDHVCVKGPDEAPKLKDRDVRKFQKIDAPCTVPGDLLARAGGKVYDCDSDNLFGTAKVRCFEYAVAIKGEGIDLTFDPWIKVVR